MNVVDPKQLTTACLVDLVKALKENNAGKVSLQQSYEDGSIAWIAIVATDEEAQAIHNFLLHLDALAAASSVETNVEKSAIADFRDRAS